MSEDLSAPTAQMLAWIDARPRTYGETMEAWRTSCPRMPVWEDAVSGRLVAVSSVAGAGLHGATVDLTDRGRSWLMEHRSPALL